MGRTNTTRRGPLPAPKVRADDPNLTRYAGLVPVIRFMTGVLRLPQALAEVADPTKGERIYKVHLVFFAFLVGALAGTWRLAHLEWLRGDAVVEKFLRLPAWPVRQVFSRVLAGLSDAALKRLSDLVTVMGLRPLEGAKDITIDLDSSVIVSFGEQEGALFGYCGKGRNRRRHHPLVASVAGPRTVIHADYRDGTAIKETETIAFLAETLRRVTAALGPVRVLLRADSGFWSRAVGDWLLARELPFVLAMPLHPGLKLLIHTTAFRALEDDPDVEVAEIRGGLLNLDERLRIAVIRRRVHDPKAPPQGKVIANDPHWRYQAIITARAEKPEEIWRLYNGRADCERVFKVAKHALGMSRLIGQKLNANHGAFLLRLLAYNADILFQLDAEEKAKEASRKTVRLGLLARQRRFYNTAGRLLCASGQWLLRVAQNERVEALFGFYAPDLAAADP